MSYQYETGDVVPAMEGSKPISGRRCVAANCGHTAGGSVTVHNFPTDEKIRQQWIQFVRVKRKEWNPSKFSVLCSVHFKDADFPLRYRLQCYTDVAGVKRRRPLPEAVPSIHAQKPRQPESSGQIAHKEKKMAVHKRELAQIMKQYERTANQEKCCMASHNLPSGKRIDENCVVPAMEGSKPISGRRCVAANCGHTAGGSVTVHNFPTDEKIRQQWIQFVRVKRKEWNPSKFSVLCSVHFKDADFPLRYRLQCYTDVAGVKRRRPLPEAVPSIHAQKPGQTESSGQIAPKEKRMAVHKRELAQPCKVASNLPHGDENGAEEENRKTQNENGNSTGLVQCLYCLEVFASMTFLNQHKRDMHEDAWRREEDAFMDIKSEMNNGKPSNEYCVMWKGFDRDETMNKEIGRLFIKPEIKEEIE
ncbi:hypothetical protein CAPTEDRAFT_218870 [Capitella teleta]|uniref:THAP-type domain-containing protein n=1 Tax=Capitella teleta TaxID=283909 RepID=R7TGV4_CAPTE|nr:hypothetical protein CAPTEDRAFT_218870 [Capitella teleta]|eukprot:ELT90791.1 hypothetical protein CAPTEDRAFT_218870 [Capitella teleta]